MGMAASHCFICQYNGTCLVTVLRLTPVCYALLDEAVSNADPVNVNVL